MNSVVLCLDSARGGGVGEEGTAEINSPKTHSFSYGPLCLLPSFGVGGGDEGDSVDRHDQDIQVFNKPCYNLVMEGRMVTVERRSDQY